MQDSWFLLYCIDFTRDSYALQVHNTVARLFRGNDTKKEYWALAVHEGQIMGSELTCGLWTKHT